MIKVILVGALAGASAFILFDLASYGAFYNFVIGAVIGAITAIALEGPV